MSQNLGCANKNVARTRPRAGMGFAQATRADSALHVIKHAAYAVRLEQIMSAAYGFNQSTAAFEVPIMRCEPIRDHPPRRSISANQGQCHDANPKGAKQQQWPFFPFCFPSWNLQSFHSFFVHTATATAAKRSPRNHHPLRNIHSNSLRQFTVGRLAPLEWIFCLPGL